jgi:hypothetical protein
VTDYTNLPIGTKIVRGEIGACPYCDRIGLVKDVDGMIFVTHSEWVLPNKDGSLSIGEDECPKKGITLKPTHPK